MQQKLSHGSLHCTPGGMQCPVQLCHFLLHRVLRGSDSERWPANLHIASSNLAGSFPFQNLKYEKTSSSRLQDIATKWCSRHLQDVKTWSSRLFFLHVFKTPIKMWKMSTSRLQDIEYGLQDLKNGLQDPLKTSLKTYIDVFKTYLWSWRHWHFFVCYLHKHRGWIASSNVCHNIEMNSSA